MFLIIYYFLEITFKLGAVKISMQIKDDGKGFAGSEGAQTGMEHSFGGNGLPGMYKRARELKGELTINSEPGKGTSIVLKFAV